MTAAVARTLYRSFLRTCKEVDSLPSPLRISDVPAHLTIGKGAPITYSPTRVYSRVAPTLTHIPLETTVRGEELVRVVRSTFRANARPSGENSGAAGSSAGAKTATDAIEEAFDALRALKIQVARFPATQVITTCGIEVEVATFHLPVAAQDTGPYAFPYRIRMVNKGRRTLRVAGRQWDFKAADQTHTSVPRHTPGVVGEYPVLKPGSAFEYMSFVELPTAEGTMEGSLQCVDLDTGDEVDLAVPPTRLGTEFALPMGYDAHAA